MTHCLSIEKNKARATPFKSFDCHNGWANAERRIATTDNCLDDHHEKKDRKKQEYPKDA
jgi:hypothetical protein